MGNAVNRANKVLYVLFESNNRKTKNNKKKKKKQKMGSNKRLVVRK